MSTVNRACVKDYKISGTNQIIEKGTQLYIPITALQMDEKYFKEPNIFNPDRFLEENVNGMNFVNQPYLPFGVGPRNCIGMRLGKIQITVALVMMVHKFHFELEDKAKNSEITYDPKSLLILPIGGINLKVSKR